MILTKYMCTYKIFKNDTWLPFMKIIAMQDRDKYICLGKAVHCPPSRVRKTSDLLRPEALMSYYRLSSESDFLSSFHFSRQNIPPTNLNTNTYFILNSQFIKINKNALLTASTFLHYMTISTHFSF